MSHRMTSHPSKTRSSWHTTPWSRAKMLPTKSSTLLPSFEMRSTTTATPTKWTSRAPPTQSKSFPISSKYKEDVPDVMVTTPRSTRFFSLILRQQLLLQTMGIQRVNFPKLLSERNLLRLRLLSMNLLAVMRCHRRCLIDELLKTTQHLTVLVLPQ